MQHYWVITTKTEPIMVIGRNKKEAMKDFKQRFADKYEFVAIERLI